jgi:hypothetical protein
VFTCTAGDFLENAPKKGFAGQEAELQDEYLLRGLGALKYDAVGLGEKDLAYGVPYLRRVAEEHGLKLVCANAVDETSREPLFAPWIVTEREGVRVAFLGVVSPERHVTAAVESQLLDQKIRIDDPSEAIRKYLPELREQQKADLVVLLAHTGIETAEFLAADVDVDVVVVGHFPAILERPEKRGNAILAMAGAKSDRFGTLDLTLAPGGGVASFEGAAVRLQIQGPSVPEIQALFDEMDRKQKDMRRNRQVTEQRERDAKAQEEAALLVQQHGGIYGAESCKTCHEPIYESWLATAHATAFATLAEADAWDDPECVGCHVTGVADKHHVSDPNLAPELWNVQCEECHGPGMRHARDGSYLGAGEATCVRCHDADNSPEFDYELYRSYGVH